MATALGRPRDALGGLYAEWDDGRRLPRMPGPPYAFMSRVVRFDGEWGQPRAGTTIEVEYDIPADAWYFDENGPRGARVMPWAVLLEAALQPCGWLTLATGIPRLPVPLFFRNLDGRGVVHRQVRPGDAPLRTEVTLTKVARSGGVILVEFDTRTSSGGALVFDCSTGFGFFPAEALAHQAGLPATAEETDRALAPAPGSVVAPGTLGGPRLQMLHRILDHDARGGAAGLGRVRAEMDVDVQAWFFRSHFFQDPVQPGSLGLQALLQALRHHAERADPTPGLLVQPPVAVPMTWRYRGQVRPHNRRVVVEVEVTEQVGSRFVADGWLWVDGVRIYGARGLSLDTDRG
jgi:3-hydroxymyristoyl/3-hydroxydecanoyl-(acyl carrier protein) dehydratase